MLLKKQDIKYKEYIKFEKERDRLWKLEKSLPYVEVEPYQSGWYIVPALREDAANSKHADVMKEVLEICINRQITMNPNFVKLLRRMKDYNKAYRTLYPKAYMSEGYSITKTIDHTKFLELSDRQKSYFEGYYPYADKTRYNEKLRAIRMYRLTIPNHYIVPKVIKRIVTREKGLDSKLLSDLAFVEDKLRELARGIWPNYSATYPSKSSRTNIRAQISHFKAGEKEDIIHPEQSINMRDYYW